MKIKSKSSIIGAVGGMLIGAAMLFFIAVIVLSSIKATNTVGPVDTWTTANPYGIDNATRISRWAEWNESNATYSQIQSFLTVATILLSVLGVVMVGAAIISYIGGAFGA